MAQDISPQPDLIQVSETVRKELHADHADLIVTVRGSSFVAGTAAFTRAREVSQLVSDLRQAGVSETDIHLQNVEAEVGTGVLGRNSSASYRLRIECRDLERLADILGAITSQKNTKLDFLRWLYPDNDDMRDALLRQCIRRANDRAHLIAEGLGVRLNGVRTFTYQFHDSEGVPNFPPVAAPQFARMKQAVSEESLGLQISHTKELVVSVSVAYRISEFVTPE